MGIIKLRGRYAHESPTERGERSRMYVRHHAFSLLALTLLGGLAWCCVENKPDVAGQRPCRLAGRGWPTLGAAA